MRQNKSRTRVARPPATPVLVYDAACGFCRHQVERWKRRTGDLIDYVPSDAPEVGNRFPEIPPQRFSQALQLIHTDGCVYAGAHGAIKARSLTRKGSWLLRMYEASPAGAAFMEFAYRLVARNRILLTRISSCVGRTDET